MNKPIYFPAMSISYLFSDKKQKYTGKDFNFYNSNNSIFKHNYVLVSAGMKYKEMEYRKKVDPARKTIFLGDSGGYQIATKKIELNDTVLEKLFNWLEKNADYAPILDIPPYGGYGDRENIQNFEHALNISIKNSKYFETHQSNKMKFLKVLHGTTLKELELWYSQMKNFNFEGGWCTGSHFGRFFIMLLQFFFLYGKGELQKYSNKKCLLHFLGYSKFYTYPFISYLQNKLNKKNIDINISFDSSSYNLLSAYGKYGLFFKRDGISSICFSNKMVVNKDNSLNIKLPCNCPVCSGYTYNDILVEMRGKEGSFKTEFYLFLSIHNLYNIIQLKNQIDRIIFCGQHDIIESIFGCETDKIIFKILDKAFESDNPVEVILQNEQIFRKIDFEEEIVTNLNKFIQM